MLEITLFMVFLEAKLTVIPTLLPTNIKLNLDNSQNGALTHHKEKKANKTSWKLPLCSYLMSYVLLSLL